MTFAVRSLTPMIGAEIRGADLMSETRQGERVTIAGTSRPRPVQVSV